MLVEDLYYFCEPAGPGAELTSNDLAQCGQRMAEYLQMPTSKDHMNTSAPLNKKIRKFLFDQKNTPLLSTHV